MVWLSFVSKHVIAKSSDFRRRFDRGALVRWPIPLLPLERVKNFTLLCTHVWWGALPEFCEILLRFCGCSLCRSGSYRRRSCVAVQSRVLT